MKYFKVTMDSQYWCGFKSNWWIEAEDEDAVWETKKYLNAYDEMQDYLLGWLQGDDDGNEIEDETEPTVDIEECSKEEYEERKDWGGCG